jgi:DNA sulfur modification protein DndD
MKLTRIVLENYGPYKGHTAFALPTTPAQPIVLFGGANGAGKTTLFNAIQVCLHGRSAFDGRLSREEYEQWLKNKLHASGGRQTAEATLRVDFEYADLGETAGYSVTREIRDRGKSVADELTVRRDGMPLSDVDSDQWEDFLKELIPPGISGLFFFDGEKVKRLAEEIKTQSAFAESLQSLLGLDLIDRLDSDLSIYLSNKLEEDGGDELAAKIETLREELSEMDDQRAEQASQIEKKTEQIAELSTQIESKEQELSEEGGAYAEKRDDHKEQRVRLEERQEVIRENIRDLATDCYPFSLAPELCRDVVSQLQAERDREQDRAAKQRATELLETVTGDERLFEDSRLDETQQAAMVESLKERFEDQLSVEEPAPYRLASEFSPREQQEMEAVVDRALEDVPAELEEMSRDLESNTKQRQKIEQQISRAPDRPAIQPVLSSIEELTNTRAGLQRDVEEHESRLEELESTYARKEASLENRLEDQEKLGSVSERAALAANVRSTVQDYREEIIRAKLDRLETALTDRYLQLTNKPGLYAGVRVHTDPVSISVETESGNVKAQGQLSAGERQIFATALLWALADISERPLPFMIDTPLARLDQEHRANLVSEFLPNAAHQVLIFSTDTEITEDRYDQLKPHIAAEYQMEALETEGQTQVSPGYFFTDAEEAVQVDPGASLVTDQYEAQARIEGFSDE